MSARKRVRVQQARHRQQLVEAEAHGKCKPSEFECLERSARMPGEDGECPWNEDHERAREDDANRPCGRRIRGHVWYRRCECACCHKRRCRGAGRYAHATYISDPAEKNASPTARALELLIG